MVVIFVGPLKGSELACLLGLLEVSRMVDTCAGQFVDVLALVDVF